MELALATPYFPFFIGSECIILLRSSGVNLNEKKTKTELLWATVRVEQSKYTLERGEKKKTNPKL